MLTGRFPLLSLPLLLALTVLADPLAAQAPKRGEWYVDDTHLGYKLRSPKDWGFLPPKPSDDQLLGKFAAPNSVTVEGDAVNFFAFLLEFDRRRGEDGKKPKLRHKDADAWVKGVLTGGAWAQQAAKETKAGGLAATEYVWSGKLTGTPIGAYAMVYHLAPDHDLVYLFTGPGGRKWKKYEGAYRKLARSFKRVEIDDDAGPVAAASKSPRDVKRAKLEDEIRRQPGWELDETENYFFIYNTDDRDFVDEVKERIEAIREVFLKDFPPEKARRKKVEGEGDQEGRTISVTDSLALSRASVVRICAKQKDYTGYGGSRTANGHWSSYNEELVVFDRKQTQGSAKTFETLSHEAFHQFIYYFYGSLSPHSWYNEGTGDYYGGFEYERRRFEPGARKNRVDTIKRLFREDRLIPLNEIVRYSQKEYYGDNPYGLRGYECYAQGWSLVWFLRSDGKRMRGWNDAWGSILDVYLDTLAETGDLEKAVDQAFAGVDWAELESSWRKFIDAL